MTPERAQESWNAELQGWQLQQQDILCRSFVFEDSYRALSFTSRLCKVAIERKQKPCFRVRDGHVFVQCAIPANGPVDDLWLLTRDLDILRSSLP